MDPLKSDTEEISDNEGDDDLEELEDDIEIEEDDEAEGDDDDNDDDDQDDNDEDDEGDEESEENIVLGNNIKRSGNLLENDDEDDEDEEDISMFKDEDYQAYVKEYHPELKQLNMQDMQKFIQITRNKNGDIIDKYHKTIPFLTKFEMTRVIGIRTTQLDYGAEPLIPINNSIIDSKLIAVKELEQNKLPFIICRPLPNGTIEYWNIKDLEVLD